MSEWQEVNFEGALAVLQGWLGHRVIVNICNAGGPVGAASVAGTLTATETVMEHGELLDEDMFEFVLNEREDAGFNLYRGTWFAGASYNEARRELHVGVGEGGWLVFEIALAGGSPGVGS